MQKDIGTYAELLSRRLSGRVPRVLAVNCDESDPEDDAEA